MAKNKKSKQKSGLNKRGSIDVRSVLNVNKRPTITKTAGYGAGAAASLTSSMFYTPELTPESWLLPKSRQEVIKWSHVENSEILTQNGLKRFEDINLETDLVLGADGTFKKIYDKAFRPYSGKINTLRCAYIPEFTVTDYHPMLGIKTTRTLEFANREKWSKDETHQFKHSLINNKEKPNDHLTWISADLIEPGDYLTIPKFKQEQKIVIDLSKYITNDKKTHSRNKRLFIVHNDKIECRLGKNKKVYFMNRFVYQTPKLAKFLGWYIAKGSVDLNKDSYLTLSKDEYSIALELKEILEDLFGLKDKKIFVKIRGSVVKLEIRNLLIGRFLADICGHGTENKHIPDIIIFSNKNIVKDFLRAWVQGEGTIRSNDFNICTISPTLASQGFMLFSKLDILTQFRKFNLQKRKNRFPTNTLYGYMLACNGYMAGKLFNHVTNAISHPQWLEDAKNFYVLVKENIRKEYEGNVYDLTVDGGIVCHIAASHNCRIFFNLEAYVQSILTMHARFPFSKFSISVQDKDVQNFYEEMIENEKWSLYDTILKASLSYWVYGEALIFGNWDKENKKWSRCVLLEPETVEVHQDMYDEDPIFELIPTEELKKIVNSPAAENIKRKEKLPEVVVKAVHGSKNIELDPRAMSIIARTTSPSAIRGTPIMQSIFKALIYQDFIRLAQIKIAERHQLPLELWTLGNLEHKILPTEDDLNDLKNMINQAIQNPPFVMVYPPILDYKVLGVREKLLNLYDDYGYVQDQIMVGLGVNKNLILGEGPSFSNVKTMSLHKLIMEYQAIRDQFEKWMINKIFRRVAEENNFYIYEGKTKKLMLPEIIWSKSLNIEGEENQRKLYFDMWEAGVVSTETLMQKFPDLDFETERKKLEKEKGSIFDSGNRLPKEFQPSPESSSPLTTELNIESPNIESPESPNTESLESPTEPTTPE